MRITRDQLQALINEEINRALLKTENRRLIESSVDADFYDADISSIIEFAQAFSGLGTAVQEQLVDILDNAEEADVNPNAVDLIEQRLGGMNASLDEALEAWKAAYEAVGGDEPEDDGSWAAAARANALRR
jgi:hypothetical protein